MFNAKDSLRGKLSAVLSNKVIARAVDKFNADRKGMLLIPLVAAFVGWFTNWLAVKMIFYPINFLGIPLFQYVEGSVYGFDILQPLGILGWQGIVPAKAAQMSLTMVTMVTEKLVNVQAVFMLLDPTAVSSLLLTEVPNMASKIASEMIPDWSLKLAESAVPALPTPTLGEVGGVVSTYFIWFRDAAPTASRSRDRFKRARRDGDVHRPSRARRFVSALRRSRARFPRQQRVVFWFLAGRHSDGRLGVL